jgi:hypothetical protein
MKKLTIQDFKDRGYKEFKEKFKDCVIALQKIVYDPETHAKRYFINVFGYDLNNSKEVEFSYDVALYRGDDLFRVNLYESNSIEHVEEFYDEMWTKLGCDIDLYNN